MNAYPEMAGFKGPETSQEAAASIEGATSRLRKLVLGQLREKPCTADECAAALGLGVLSIRPRLSELRMCGLIHDTGDRRANASGRRAVVWALV